jgi:hypothetical protein
MISLGVIVRNGFHHRPPQGEGAASFHGHVPSHLLHPLFGWMGGDSSDVYPPAREILGLHCFAAV